MNLSRISALAGMIGIAASLAFTTPGETDPLRKRKFVAQAVEWKDGKATTKKPAEDKIEFNKKGEVYSSYLAEKTEFVNDYKYEITKDSTFNGEGGEELHYLEAQVVTTNEEKKETLNMNIKVNGYEIEVVYKVIKKEQVKKHYVSTGKEVVKEKKKKKED